MNKTDTHSDAETGPVPTVQDLVKHFHDGEKAEGRFRIGVEHEKIGVALRPDGVFPLPYEDADPKAPQIRALLAVGFATLSLVASSSAAKAATLEALSDTDARLYSNAFQAAERGDFATADDSLAHVKDPCLVGRVQFLKLTHPAVTKNVSYDQLVGWLRSFKDMPGADRIYALALRLRPAGEEPPPPEKLSDARFSVPAT